MAYAARALENGELERLFGVIDERSRHALYSIHADREAAASLIRADYPEELQEDALGALGLLGTDSPAALFAERCDLACQRDLTSRIGAPMEETQEGEELLVTTSRGQVRLWRGGESAWWGIVWNHDELDRERDRAGQDLRRIEANAETYRRRDALQD